MLEKFDELQSFSKSSDWPPGLCSLMLGIGWPLVCGVCISGAETTAGFSISTSMTSLSDSEPSLAFGCALALVTSRARMDNSPACVAARDKPPDAAAAVVVASAVTSAVTTAGEELPLNVPLMYSCRTALGGS